MRKRLIIGAIILFPLWIVINRYVFDRSWPSSVFGAVVWEVVYVSGMLFFIKWWTKKVEEQKNN